MSLAIDAIDEYLDDLRSQYAAIPHGRRGVDAAIGEIFITVMEVRAAVMKAEMRELESAPTSVYSGGLVYGKNLDGEIVTQCERCFEYGLTCRCA